MKAKKAFQRTRLFLVTLTLTGILMGLVLALLAAWADYESTAYGFVRRVQAPFQGLICPVFIGRNESTVVSMEISNPTDQTLSPGVRVRISTPSEPDSRLEHIRLTPGEKITLHRTVGPENVGLGMFIFVDVLVYSTYPLPNRETTCGILVLPIVNSTHCLVLGTAISISLMAAGIYMLCKRDRPGPRCLFFMVVASILAMTLGFIGWWLADVILIVVLILTIFIRAGAFLTQQNDA
jgi:hypothetical protein